MTAIRIAGVQEAIAGAQEATAIQIAGVHHACMSCDFDDPSMQAILLKPRACITMHGPSRYKITNKPLARKNVPILSTTQQVASRKDGGCNAFLVRDVFKHWAAEVKHKVEMRKCNALLERTNPEPYQHYDTDDSDYYDGSDYDAEAEGWGITRTVVYVQFPRRAG